MFLAGCRSNAELEGQHEDSNNDRGNPSHAENPRRAPQPNRMQRPTTRANLGHKPVLEFRHQRLHRGSSFIVDFNRDNPRLTRFRTTLSEHRKLIAISA
jgi:hypothetical protein